MIRGAVVSERGVSVSTACGQRAAAGDAARA
jgi:hypothetical protein